MPCSRTQHGLTRVVLGPPTSGSGVRGINHQATTLLKQFEDRVKSLSGDKLLRRPSRLSENLLNVFFFSSNVATLCLQFRETEIHLKL